MIPQRPLEAIRTSRVVPTPCWGLPGNIIISNIHSSIPLNCHKANPDSLSPCRSVFSRTFPYVPVLFGHRRVFSRLRSKGVLTCTQSWGVVTAPGQKSGNILRNQRLSTWLRGWTAALKASKRETARCAYAWLCRWWMSGVCSCECSSR